MKRVVLLGAGENLQVGVAAGAPYQLEWHQRPQNGFGKLLGNAWALVNLSLPAEALRDGILQCANTGCHYLDAEPDPQHRARLARLIGHPAPDGPAYVSGLHPTYLLLRLLLDRLNRHDFQYLHVRLELQDSDGIGNPGAPDLMPLWAAALRFPLLPPVCEAYCARLAKVLTRRAARLQIEVWDAGVIVESAFLESRRQGPSHLAAPILAALDRLSVHRPLGWLPGTDLFCLEEVEVWVREAGFRLDLPLTLSPEPQALSP